MTDICTHPHLDMIQVASRYEDEIVLQVDLAEAGT
jgi:hypothetical protein